MAVRVATALKPFKPSSAISMDGILNADGVCGLVAVPYRFQLARTSLRNLGVRVEVNPTVAACERAGLTLARPLGVACPSPSLIRSSNMKRVFRECLELKLWSTRADHCQSLSRTMFELLSVPTGTEKADQPGTAVAG